MADAIAELTGQADTVTQAVLEMLEGLPAAEWSRPSDCAGWTVANVAAHLVLVEALLGGSVTRGLKGDSGPPPQALAGPNSWMEYRTRRIAELGALTPDQLLIQLRTGRAELLDAFGRLAATNPPSGPAGTRAASFHWPGSRDSGWSRFLCMTRTSGHRSIHGLTCIPRPGRAWSGRCGLD